MTLPNDLGIRCDHDLRAGDPDEPSGLRLVRGGAWNLGAAHCRAARRYGYTAHHVLTSCGIRLVAASGAP